LPRVATLSKPTVSLRTIRKKLKTFGFHLARQAKHEIWEDNRGHVVSVPHGNRDVGKGLLKAICSQAGISLDDFLSP
jgi:predicted RNA binding protein YcfA (HicA-like mRNA interferase family)